MFLSEWTSEIHRMALKSRVYIVQFLVLVGQIIKHQEQKQSTEYKCYLLIEFWILFRWKLICCLYCDKGKIHFYHAVQAQENGKASIMLSGLDLYYPCKFVVLCCHRFFWPNPFEMGWDKPQAHNLVTAP